MGKRIILHEKNEDKKEIKKKRVCGYARVSTDKNEQLNSYDAQIKYYTDYINLNPCYEFVGLYSDEGISGTSTKNREGSKTVK